MAIHGGGRLLRNRVTARTEDLDDYLIPGVFAADNPTNAPDGAGRYVVQVSVYEEEGGARRVLHEATKLSDLSKWLRVFNGSTWGDWTQLTGGGGGGPTPDPDTVEIAKVADAAISGLRVVVDLGSNRVRHADPGTLSDAYRILGVTLDAAAEDEDVMVKLEGQISSGSFSFTPGEPVFVSADGALTQTPPALPGSLYRVVVGYAVSATVLTLRISEPVELV